LHRVAGTVTVVFRDWAVNRHQTEQSWTQWLLRKRIASYRVLK
jgi:hypothetical protein